MCSLFIEPNHHHYILNIDFKKLEHGLVIMDESGWHTEEIANDFKMSVSSNFHPILQS
ncbi:hypothetical protein R7P77_25745 [Vibrio sp. 2025]|nr:hypothetical protein [Vibrio sp. 2025]